MAKKDVAIRLAAAMTQKARMLCRTAQHAPLVAPLPQAVVDSVSQPPQATVQVTSLNLESREAARSASSEQWRRSIGAALTLQPGLPVPLVAGGAASVGLQTDGSNLKQLRGSTDCRYQLKTVTLHMRSLGDFRSHLQMTPTALADACAVTDVKSASDFLIKYGSHAITAADFGGVAQAVTRVRTEVSTNEQNSASGRQLSGDVALTGGTGPAIFAGNANASSGRTRQLECASGSAMRVEHLEWRSSGAESPSCDFDKFERAVRDQPDRWILLSASLAPVWQLLRDKDLLARSRHAVPGLPADGVSLRTAAVLLQLTHMVQQQDAAVQPQQLADAWSKEIKAIPAAGREAALKELCLADQQQQRRTAIRALLTVARLGDKHYIRCAAAAGLAGAAAASASCRVELADTFVPQLAALISQRGGSADMQRNLGKVLELLVASRLWRHSISRQWQRRSP